MIDKHVPMPVIGPRDSYKNYEFENLQVGDSFVPDITKAQRKNFAVLMHSAGKRFGFKFSGKEKENDDGVLEYRVWRVK